MLEGVKVVEMATRVAAPSVGGLLADWGASVVKIEPHTGDPMRGRPGYALGSINFEIHNRGKRSIALDTGAPDTRDAALRRYLDLLSAGGSDHPMTLLKAAGVDLSSPDTVQAVIDQLDALVTRLEGLL